MWKMPPFIRVQLVTESTYKVIYDDDDPGNVLSETKCDFSESSIYPKDGLYGKGAVETVLTEILKR